MIGIKCLTGIGEPNIQDIKTGIEKYIPVLIEKQLQTENLCCPFHILAD